LTIYDALIVSAALLANCKTVHSEDMQDGQVVERQLTIRNPFTSSQIPARSRAGPPHSVSG
jgi:predicted nucleic acid-binding protein